MGIAKGNIKKAACALLWAGIFTGFLGCGKSSLVGDPGNLVQRPLDGEACNPSHFPLIAPAHSSVGVHIRPAQWTASTLDVFFNNGFVNSVSPSFDNFEYTVDPHTPNFAPTTYFDPWKLSPLANWAKNNSVPPRAIFRFTRKSDPDPALIYLIPRDELERNIWVDIIWNKISQLYPNPSDGKEHIVGGYNEPTLGWDPASPDPEMSNRPERHALLFHAWVQKQKSLGRCDVKMIEPSIHNVTCAECYTYLTRFLAAVPAADLAFLKIGFHAYATVNYPADSNGVPVIRNGLNQVLSIVSPYGFSVKDFWVNEFGGMDHTGALYTVGTQALNVGKTLKNYGIPLHQIFAWAEPSDTTDPTYIFGEYGNALKTMAAW